MDKRLILPKKGFLLNTDKDNPRLYFLAGPVMGGGDWRRTAIHRLMELDKDCYIVCPCRYPADDPISWLAIKTDVGLPTSQIEFESQIKWERHYLELASIYGAIIFWLPVEDKDNPRPKADGPYARDTYGELGRWSVRSSKELATVIVGADPKFSGLSVIQKNFDEDHGEPFKIHNTLDETLFSAVRKGRIYRHGDHDLYA